MEFLYKNKTLIAVLGGLFVFAFGFLALQYPQMILPVHLFLSSLFSFIILKLINFNQLKSTREKEIKNDMQKEKEKVLKSYNSYVNQLSNIIAGLNHEVAPWLGGIQNKIARLREKSAKLNNPNRKRMSDAALMTPEYILKKLADIELAADTAIQILKTRSRDVKKLQRYSTAKTDVFDTVNTWVGMAMVDQTVKSDISSENIFLQEESLKFEVELSPLLLSQVILNLVKNSVEHNTHMLENLLITISGDSTRQCIIYEDNGKGIPDENVDTVFEFGITSKIFEKELHGLGLSLCIDYCECMGAAITAERSKTGAKFVIYFNYDFEKNPANIKNVKNRNNGTEG